MQAQKPFLIVRDPMGNRTCYYDPEGIDSLVCSCGLEVATPPELLKRALRQHGELAPVDARDAVHEPYCAKRPNVKVVWS